MLDLTEAQDKIGKKMQKIIMIFTILSLGAAALMGADITADDFATSDQLIKGTSDMVQKGTGAGLYTFIGQAPLWIVGAGVVFGFGAAVAKKQPTDGFMKIVMGSALGALAGVVVSVIILAGVGGTFFTSSADAFTVLKNYHMSGVESANADAFKAIQ